MTPHEGFVYFVEIEDRNAIAIGFALNVYSRFHAIKFREQPSEVKLLGSYPADKESKRLVYQRFKKDRINSSSYFRSSPEMLDWIKSSVQTETKEERQEEKLMIMKKLNQENEKIREMIQETKFVCRTCGGTEIIKREDGDYCVTCLRNSEKLA